MARYASCWRTCVGYLSTYFYDDCDIKTQIFSSSGISQNWKKYDTLNSWLNLSFSIFLVTYSARSEALILVGLPAQSYVLYRPTWPAWILLTVGVRHSKLRPTPRCTVLPFDKFNGTHESQSHCPSVVTVSWPTFSRNRNVASLTTVMTS